MYTGRYTVAEKNGYETNKYTFQETTKILLEENVVVSGARLREKYLKKLEEADKEEKISE